MKQFIPTAVTRSQMKPIAPEEIDTIEKEYRSQIAVPEHRPAVQYLLCPVGLVGAGKTTVIKPLAERLGLVRISSDEVRKLLWEHGYGGEAMPDIVIRVGRDFLRQGYSLAVDADCASDREQKLIAQAVKEFGVKVQWIHINPPEEFIINKLSNYPHTWLFKDADDAVANYRARKLLHEKLDMPFTYVFDTSATDLDRQIDEGARAIEKALQ